jgi:hypothetical protein
MTECPKLTEPRCLHRALRASLVILVLMLVAHAILSKLRRPRQEGFGSADDAKNVRSLLLLPLFLKRQRYKFSAQ